MLFTPGEIPQKEAQEIYNPKGEPKMTDVELKLTNKFRRQVKALNKTILEAREIWPEAQYYLASEGLNLMSGSPHTGAGDAHPERVIETQNLIFSDGGDW